MPHQHLIQNLQFHATKLKFTYKKQWPLLIIAVYGNNVFELHNL